MVNQGSRTQVILTDDIKEKLGAISTSRGSNLSATIRIALADWLKREYGITVNPHLQRGGGDRHTATAQD